MKPLLLPQVAVKVLNRENVTGSTMARWREEVR
jgi:hypothetical protein